MKVTATQMRQNIYAILDQALATGEPVEIERKGKILRIVPETAAKPVEDDDDYLKEFPKFAKLKKHDWFVGDPEDFVHMDWSHTWSELKNMPPKRKRK